MSAVVALAPFWAPFWSRFGSQVRYYTPFGAPGWPKQAQQKSRNFHTKKGAAGNFGDPPVVPLKEHTNPPEADPQGTRKGDWQTQLALEHALRA